MCQATIILHGANGEQELVKDVIHLKVEEDLIWCSRYFEDPTCIKAQIKSIDFLKHTVHLAPLNEEQG
jgi:predicted RNA-binding protein